MPKIAQNFKPSQAKSSTETTKKAKDCKPAKPVVTDKIMPQPRLRAAQNPSINFMEETDSDQEFNSKALPNPDNEPQQFFVDLVREVNLETGKKYLCQKCRNSFTRC